MNLLVDTNIILYLLHGDQRVKELLDGENIHLSFITELELLSYPELSDSEEKEIIVLLEMSVIHDINSQVKKNCIQLRKKYSLKLPDAIIASTALSLDMMMLSNDSIFERVSELNLITYN